MAAPSAPRKSLKRKSKDGFKPHKKPMKSSKTKKSDSENAVQSKILPMSIEDDAPDFPRGGGSVLSRREEQEARAEVDAEFEVEERELKKKKKKSRKAYAQEEDLGSLFGDGITGKLPRFANKITFKNISAGMKLWGLIVEVNPNDLVISLPGGLRGFVHAEEASELFSDEGIKDTESSSLSSIFLVGQLVSCIVLQVDDDKKGTKGSKRIWLSLRLTLLHKGLTLDAVQDGMVLTAYVKSIEDRGYLLHFGSSSFSGFLKRKIQSDSNEIKMGPGQLVQGVVESIDKARGIIYLNSDQDLVSKYVTKDLKGLSIDLLVPGMMVNARVQSNLENGIMLSFLTYFTGTVDIFHLQSSLPSANWRDDYHQNKRVNARILFIDPSTRAVGLTMNHHLVHNRAPPSYIKVGDIYDNSRVVRVDKGFGLLLEIPSAPVSTPGYISIFEVADEEVRKLEKRFKEGSQVRVRVLGFRNLEGLAMGSLKASALEGPFFTHSDIKPGLQLKAKIISVENFGAIVQFASGMKALCPLPHMSELDIVKPAKKFKMGTELLFRVLGCKSKRITVTHKKTLLKSKLPILASYADATEGLVTHGWITKIEKHGCFVRFYNGVQGFAHRSQLALEPGTEASSLYHVGQVVKCRVISAAAASRRINLSFEISPKRASTEDGTSMLGTVISGVVERLTPSAVIVQVNAGGYSKGTIFTEHLADHQGHADLMKSLLKPGYEFEQLLVLDVDGSSLILSAKYSLIRSSEQLPLDIAQVHPHVVVHGYVCNSIESGCFVRFLGRLTGFAPKNKAIDNQKADLSEIFYTGQSVRSQILNVDGERGRITLSLKQSCCFSTDASFIHGYFHLEDKIAKLQLSDSKNSGLKWLEKISVGNLVEGEVQEIKEYGVVVNFKEHSDIVGFISQNELGGRNVETGSVVQAFVLDIAKADGLIDLSLKQNLIDSIKEKQSSTRPSKKKRQREAGGDLELHQTVNATVEIVKENYLVLSLPEYNNVIGYASIHDYNTQKLPPQDFRNGQSVVATVEALPSSTTTGRLLLLLKSLSEVAETSSSKRAKKKSSYNVGSVVEAEITDIKPLELQLKFGIGFHGRVHITEVTDDAQFQENPLSKFRVGQLLTASIVAKISRPGKNTKNCRWELSVKPSVLAGPKESENGLSAEVFNFELGKIVSGYVVKVDNEWVWLTISRSVKAQLFILDSSSEPRELEEFQKRFYVGKAVSGTILSINKEKKLLRLTLREASAAAASNDNVKIDDAGCVTPNNCGSEHIVQDDILGGRISKILPGVGGLTVQIGPHLYGKVCFTELTDVWVSDPLEGYQEGQFVKCKVLEVSCSFKGTTHVDLSLRASSIGFQSVNPAEHDNHLNSVNKLFEKIEDLHPNMGIRGYVKNVTSKGCFIMLSRKIDAKVLLSHLSDGYVENPEKEFPVGKLVTGKVLSVEPLSKRVEVTLKTVVGNKESKSDVGDLSKLRVGDIISGRIRKTEKFGLFITIDHTNVVGLCHISELSDDHIDKIETRYRAGERVTAKILKVDKEKHRVALGMKDSYIGESTGGHVVTDHKTSGLVDDYGTINDLQLDQNDKLLGNEDVYSEDANTCDHPVFTEAESRALVPPLEVTLDELEGTDVDNAIIDPQEHSNATEMMTEKNQRRTKKKANEEREREIQAAEARLLEKDMPQTVEDFEKMVRSSPNSSFVWIKYMAFMLSLADVEKARSIAERALRTINIREEGEKLNIWVAYFNLENEYGSPPEEAVMKIFQRALQYCDPKMLHFALLGMYERTEQHKLADELLDRMVKKFKSSCKVWLRRIQSMLKQGKDGVQSVVNRALLSLPRNKHIKFISQTAILEFKCGVPDRGRSMFEGILREYPKRTDLWSIYLDQEIRLGDVEVIRALFERATCLSLPPKKMKFIFKKYLEFEKSQNEEERVEYVKKKAMEYVESS